jgi:subtilisin family serine protease
MTTQRVIVYTLHEHELSAAHDAIPDAVAGESYVIGDADDATVDSLRAQGLIVEPADRAPAEVEDLGTVRGLPQDALGELGGAGAPGPQPISPEETQFWVTRLDTPLLGSQPNEVAGTGAGVIGRTGQFDLLVKATPQQANQLINLGFVSDVVPHDPARDVLGLAVSAARTRGLGEAAAVTFDVRTIDEQARDDLAEWLVTQGVAVVGRGGRKVRFLMAPDSPMLADVARRAGFVPAEYVEPVLHNDVVRGLIGVEVPGQQDLGYTGAGEIVAVADTGFDDAHPDLQNRLHGLVGMVVDPTITADVVGHGTHVAGTILGDGSASAGRFRGIAPGAKLYGQAIADRQGRLRRLPVDLNILLQDAYDAGARIHNDSWGAGARIDSYGFKTGGMYTDNSDEIDEFVYEHPDMVVVISAGNDGTASDPFNPTPGQVGPTSIGAPASSKNAITVGASRSSRTDGGWSASTYFDHWPTRFPDLPLSAQKVSGDPQALAAFSGRGPCDDRRVKPDVVAPGTDVLSLRATGVPDGMFWGVHAGGQYAFLGGTSMAAPVVTGCAALVREYYRTVEQRLPSAALVKATLINGTKWLRGTDAVAGFAMAPNSNQGYGMVFMPTTIPNASIPNLRLEFVDTWDTSDGLRSSSERFVYEVGVGDSLPLRVTVAHTDRPGRGQQNDIFLLVEDPAPPQPSPKHLGNEHLAGSGLPDVDNNVEAVRIDAPKVGTYRVYVIARNILVDPGAKHDFALVITGDLTSPLQRVAH